MIELKDIEFSYDNTPLLRDVNITIEDSDFVAITGCNGCGKTTLIKLILGLLKPQRGKILFSKEGKRVKHLAIGYLPQISSIDRQFPISVRETVALGLLDRNTIFRPSLTSSEHERINKVLNRMDIISLADKPIAELSGGELQRTMLARAIVMQPDVLILDEPNTYLDNTSENRLYKYLEELNGSCTIILVTHDEHNIKKLAKHIAYVNGSEQINMMPML